MSTTADAIIDEVFGILEEAGPARYGMEAINQLEHALQCAWLAEQDGASPALITAALLHDIGHLIHKLGYAAERGIDDRHEELGRKYLRKYFDDAVVDPVAMHVDAKRYLCATEPSYFSTLSAGSVRSLELQGGPFEPDAARRFAARQYGRDAVRLRRWDEGAKVRDLQTPNLDHFRDYAKSSLKPDAAVAA